MERIRLRAKSDVAFNTLSLPDVHQQHRCPCMMHPRGPIRASDVRGEERNNPHAHTDVYPIWIGSGKGIYQVFPGSATMFGPIT